MKRIIVTGSRDWTDVATIELAIDQAFAELGEFVLMHGACPTGANAIAHSYQYRNQGSWITYPADWKTYGRAAGPRRNAEMVAVGADLCLAFIGPCTSPRCHIPGTHASHGASYCANTAEDAGIPVRRFFAEELQ